ncbi:MAG: FGGY-family carbohydrate kinase [Alphaproteobacteria bacterium]|nr:FGGY-family carbohydrate kinase [Alphaproteobacteria bacterium]
MTVLAADIGGSSLKAALISRAGAVVAQAALPSPPPDAGGMIAPAGWWTAFRDAAATLKGEDASAFAAVAAIAVTGVTRTPVVLDDDANPLIGAMPARDARASAIAARDAIDPQDCAEAAHYDAFHPAARLKWISATWPDVVRKAAAVVDPKDFIAARLTGRIASDAIASARLAAAADAARGRSLLSRLGLPDRLVPDLLAPGSIIAPVRGGLDAPFGELAGRPVVMASHDTWCGVVGLGALVPGRAYNISGTTETFGVLSRAPAKAEGLIDLQWGDDVHQLGGPGQNGADVVTWLGELFGTDASAELARALAQPRDAAPLIFLPYLSGERVPFWDADLRGAFLGLSRQHGRSDLVRAVLEGIAFLNATVLSRAEAATGITVEEVRFGGGGTRIAEWAQIKSDILRRPVVTVAVEEPGVLGAALAAFVALGTHDTLARAQQLMVRVAQRFEPRAAQRDFYRALGRLFGAAHDAVRPISHALSKISTA